MPFAAYRYRATNLRGSSISLQSFERTTAHAALSPNSITPTFTKTSRRGKCGTHVTKIANTNGDKS